MNKLLENHQIYQGKHCFGFAYISPEFIFRQNATDNLEELKDLYMFKHCLYDMIHEEDNTAMIINLTKDVEYIELEIQRLFNFEPNINFHRFWENPKCCCPVMDNMDNWGTGFKIYSGRCLIHGGYTE